MAVEWIKWMKGLANKREVLLIAAELGIDRHEVAGRLMALWEWCDENITGHEVDETGNAMVTLGALPERTIDVIAGVTGFAQAMANAQWLRLSNIGATFPNFARHNGETAKARALTAKRVAKHKAKGNASGNDEVTLPPLPNALPRREEKRDTNERTNDAGTLESAEAEIRATWPELFEEPYTLEIEPDRSKRMTSPLNAVTDATVVSARATSDWFAAQCYARRPVLPCNVRWLAIAIAWSEIAKRGKRPAAVFVSLVKKLRVSEATDHVQAAVATVNAMYRAGQITLAKINGVATHA